MSQYKHTHIRARAARSEETAADTRQMTACVCVCVWRDRAREEDLRWKVKLLAATKSKESAVVEVHPACVQKSTSSPSLLCGRPNF